MGRFSKTKTSDGAMAHVAVKARRVAIGLGLWLVGMLPTTGPVPQAQGASLEDIKTTWIGWSSVKITESGFDFGGETSVAGAPTASPR